ncbi:MAG: hypothetical protein GF331_13395, partial [Chitinivibrionales bacterium]|nr:hypothetical protein [Chitinivibrionales bacterium]
MSSNAALYELGDTVTLEAYVYLPAICDSLTVDFDGDGVVDTTLTLDLTDKTVDTTFDFVRIAADTADTGAYTYAACLHASGLAEALEQTGSYEVGIAPVILSGPSLAGSPVIGEPCTLKVDAGGTAPLSFRWRHNGNAVSDADSTSLVIQSLAAADSGIYTCVVVNTFDSVTSDEYLLSPRTPDSGPTPVPAVYPQHGATGVAVESFSFRWQAAFDADGDRISYIVVHGIDSTDCDTAAATTDTTYTPLMGLQPGTEYVWALIVAAGSDTVRCPGQGFYTFRTVTRTPGAVPHVSPADGARSVESVDFTFSWGAADYDGSQAVTYVLRYGSSPSDLSLGTLTADTIVTPSTPLQGNTDYYWTVTVVVGGDSVRCPEVGVYAFRTADHQAVFSRRLSDTAISVDDSLSFVVQATDREGIRHYAWDFDGDGVHDLITETPTAGYRFADTGTHFLAVYVVDRTDSITADTATIIVTDNPPVVRALGPDTLVGLGDTVTLGVEVTDDGHIVEYAWNIARYNEYTPDQFHTTSTGDTTFKGLDRELPDSLLCVVRVTDDDGNVTHDSVVVRQNMIWVCATEQAPWSPRARVQVVEFLGRMFLVGGCGSSVKSDYEALARDVWSSADGATWE